MNNIKAKINNIGESAKPKSQVSRSPIAQVRLEKVAVALIPYLIGLFLLLFFILIVPELTMFLPNLLSN